MKEFLDHPLTQFFITIIAIMAGIVLVKMLVNYLPDGNPITRNVKKVLLSV